MSTYIIEKRNSGNAGILKINSDSTYELIAFSAGDSNLDNIINMVKSANNNITDEFLVADRKKFLSDIITVLNVEQVNEYSIITVLKSMLEEM